MSDKVKFGTNPEARTLLVLLRISGRTQEDAGNILGVSRVAISKEESEPRHKEKMAGLASILARKLLPEKHWGLFPDKEELEEKLDTGESDLDKILKKLHV